MINIFYSIDESVIHKTNFYKYMQYSYSSIKFYVVVSIIHLTSAHRSYITPSQVNVCLHMTLISHLNANEVNSQLSRVDRA